jgi:hypothetical protein
MIADIDDARASAAGNLANLRASATRHENYPGTAATRHLPAAESTDLLRM